MNETVVAFTDYALVTECAVFAVALVRTRAASLDRTLWLVFFGATACAALLGGTVHGFFPDETSRLGAALWTGTMLAIGVVGWSTLALAARLGLEERAARLVIRIGLGELTVYAAVVMLATRAYWLALAQYAPFGALWLAAVAREYLRRRDRATLLGLTGLCLGFAAAAIQFFRVAIPAAGLDHNSLYHLVQMIGLALLFGFARSRLAVRDGGPRGS